MINRFTRLRNRILFMQPTYKSKVKRLEPLDLLRVCVLKFLPSELVCDEVWMHDVSRVR